MTLTPYTNLTAYYGDIHNHCGLSYGRGTLDEALHNARMQLDFASVTVHGYWPDVPRDDARLDYLVDYHDQGFARAEANWPGYLDAIDAADQPGSFVTLPSFEWHSMAYGDHCIYFRDSAAAEIFAARDIDDLRARLRGLRARGHETMLLPHHVGYLQGYRGINWATFSPEFSPVVEIFSFHGLSEYSDAPLPYLHSMGPRDERSTIQYALAQGHVFGFIASTDDHSAHPGTYGYGRVGVWADDLSRESIWAAINARRTYALTGDRIALEFALNEQPMGSVLVATPERWLEVAVAGGDSLDYVEIIHNNRVIHRESVFPTDPDWSQPVRVILEVGWGEEKSHTDWDVDLHVREGRLLAVEPRLRGHEVGPPKFDDEACAFSAWERPDDQHVRLTTRTWPNPSVRSAGTQILCLTLAGEPSTRISGTINSNAVDLTLADIATGARVGYTRGFVSPAYTFHRVVPRAECQTRVGLLHRGAPTQRDWYYARVRQRNGQWAWSSPVWVEAAGSSR